MSTIYNFDGDITVNGKKVLTPDTIEEFVHEGPQGPTGPQGQTGPQGPTGATGSSTGLRT